MNFKSSYTSCFARAVRLAAWVLIATSGSGFLSEPAAAQASRSALSFGIVPQQAASELVKAWAPLIGRLTSDSGVEIRFRTTTDIPTFESCLAKGAFDLAYMNPYHYAVFHETSGYQSFARAADDILEGLVVVRRDSPITALKELSGQQIAFPAPAALAASVIPRAELRAAGVSFEPKYTNSHDSVYRAVLAQLFPAGGGIRRTYENLDSKAKSDLRIIHTTRPYPSHPFAFHPRSSGVAVAAITRALLAIDDRDGTLLGGLGVHRFEAAADSDYDVVRALKLKPEDTGVSDGGVRPCPFD